MREAGTLKQLFCGALPVLIAVLRVDALSRFKIHTHINRWEPDGLVYIADQMHFHA